MNLQDLANVANVATALVAIPAALFALFQLLEMKRSAQLTGFRAVIDFLQEERVRVARRITISLNGKALSDWTKAEEEAADLALRKFNSVALMVKERMISPELVLTEWKTSLLLCWDAAKPLVEKYRSERFPTYWQHLEVLCSRARQ